MVRESGLPHTVFLQRLAGAPSAGSLESRLGQGAFLALRLVDLLEYRQPVYADAFHYQHAATARFCRELPIDCTETAHLVGLTRSAADAFQAEDVRLVLPALLAYAHQLEDELRLDEAADVLETVVRVGGEQVGPEDAILVWLRIGRVHRKANRFDAADAAYEAAHARASSVGDPHSALLSRIGRANAMLGRGNLDDAERLLREILVDCERLGDGDAQARAHQGIAVVLSTRGQPAEALAHVWRTFELYEDEPSRTRALADLGIMLLIVGDAEGAERALTAVVRRGGAQEAVNNALIELMHCASYRRDRLAVERWREQCEAHRESMPPNSLADFYLKTGIGRARFGQLDRADALMARALEIAAAAGLHEFVFRIERIRGGLGDCHTALNGAPVAAAELAVQSQAIRQVSLALAHLWA